MDNEDFFYYVSSVLFVNVTRDLMVLITPRLTYRSKVYVPVCWANWGCPVIINLP